MRRRVTKVFMVADDERDHASAGASVGVALCGNQQQCVYSNRNFLQYNSIGKLNSMLKSDRFSTSGKVGRVDGNGPRQKDEEEPERGGGR
ncbi:UNVERIFIED_CONTAM: hypothetical protein PYX00_004212 [Menopon gallinae]|uniref:Uncharacterized protein n=1 Tax=Menopon gallinae TaxID=328185 RepID=A0AAW2I3E5_9NEOP